MKLFIMPGACSLAPHIVLHELGAAHKIVKVNRHDKRTNDGRDYMRLVPQGYVPALELDDGRILTEVAAIVQYLADTHPDKNLAPKCGTFERALVQQWLSFTSSELHKNFGPLFSANATETEKQNAKARLTARFNIVENQLEKTPYLVGDSFTVADAYLYVILTWCAGGIFKLMAYPAIQKYQAEIARRPSVKDAHEDEGN